MTARMILVFSVALINLGLGFAAAVHAGRGPWSRYARRYSGISRSGPQVVKSIEQISKELEGLEQRFQELVQLFSGQTADRTRLEELRTIIRTMAVQVESLGTDEHHEQASTGLRTLLLVLKTATTDLGKAIDSEEAGSLDPVPLLTSLQMACREVSMVFNALLFAELPT